MLIDCFNNSNLFSMQNGLILTQPAHHLTPINLVYLISNKVN